MDEEIFKDLETVRQVEVEEKILEANDSTEDIRTVLAKATISQRMKYALFGAAACRAILIRDPNKLISLNVLKNPRIQIREIEEFSKSISVSEQVLRSISQNSQWIKDYSVKLALVTNPKTPLDVSLNWLKYLRAADLKKISKSRNVPSTLSTAAKKIMAK